MLQWIGIYVLWGLMWTVLLRYTQKKDDRRWAVWEYLLGIAVLPVAMPIVGVVWLLTREI